MQIILLSVLCYEILSEGSTESLLVQADPVLNAARIICGIMLHYCVEPDLRQGLSMMKYAVNTEWRFQYYKNAYLIGFLQLTISIIVEVTNYIVIFIKSTTVLEVVADFLVVLVISEFDDYIYTVSGSSYFKKLITEEKFACIFEIETTSSKSASIAADVHKINESKYLEEGIYFEKRP